jgi:hypothetical protein
MVLRFESQVARLEAGALIELAQRYAGRLLELATLDLDKNLLLRDEFAEGYRSVTSIVARATSSRGHLADEVDAIVGPVLALPGDRVRAWCGPVAPDQHPGRVVVGYENGTPFELRVYPVGYGEFLARDPARAFIALVDRAARERVRLRPNSGFRTLEEQEHLFECFVRGESATVERPGFSGHQRGISIDIAGIGDYGSRAHAWVVRHAVELHLVNDVPGEPWHWTYDQSTER